MLPTRGRCPLRWSFRPAFPISAKVREIATAIDAHPVVIVAGATGSGKTTQLPKIALAMGRGLDKLIGVTQPRRIAATSVASRVAEELGTKLGEDVGYQVRFDNRTSAQTYVKFMTDGILLAEIEGDPLLKRYDTIVIDEAHERSLTIDFLLGWVKRILPQRPDLKVIVSSATIEHERFSEFFDGAPVIQVEGRTFPVDVLYEPPPDDADHRRGGRRRGRERDRARSARRYFGVPARRARDSRRREASSIVASCGLPRCSRSMRGWRPASSTRSSRQSPSGA